MHGAENAKVIHKMLEHGRESLALGLRRRKCKGMVACSSFSRYNIRPLRSVNASNELTAEQGRAVSGLGTKKT